MTDKDNISKVIPYRNGGTVFNFSKAGKALQELLTKRVTIPAKCVQAEMGK